MSVSNSVDPSRNDIISLPNSPFPEGLINIRGVLDDLGDTPILLENDVNLAAHAERRVGVARDASSFGYLYLGSGLGFAFHLGDQLIRGARGTGRCDRLPADRTRRRRGRCCRRWSARASAGRTVRRSTCGRYARGPRPRSGQRPGGRDEGRHVCCRTLVVAVAAVHAVNDPELLGTRRPDRQASVAVGTAAVSRWPNSSRSSATITASAVDGSAALRGATMRALAEGRQQLLNSSASIG